MRVADKYVIIFIIFLCFIGRFIRKLAEAAVVHAARRMLSGYEEELQGFIESMLPAGLEVSFFIPLYENVWRSGGRGHISIQRLFPGYLFAETAVPEELFMVFKKVPKFTRLLNMEDDSGEKVFLSISGADEEFLRSLMDEEHVIRVSYIHKDKSGRIDQLIGPLKKYEDSITKLDIPHRRAIVSTHIFGKDRIIKFGLWTDADPVTPWLREMKGLNSNMGEASGATEEASACTADIGIYIGDRVRDRSGVYGDVDFTVTEVDPRKRLIKVSVELFGSTVTMEMDAEMVEVCG